MSNEKTAISEIKNLMKKFGFYTETPIVEEKFLDAKLKDGTVIKVEGEELVEGAKVVVVTEEGEIPAPDGVHELEDGSKVETKEGIVAKIEAPEMEEEPSVEIEVEAEEEEVVEDKVDVTEELYALLKDMMEKISDKMKKMEEKMEKVENDFENFKKEPASSKIKTGKTEEKFSKENNLLEDRIKTVMALRGK